MNRVWVDVPGDGYDVVLADGFEGLAAAFAAATGADRAVLVTDEVVGPLWADVAAEALGVGVDRVILPAGERHKTLETWRGAVDAVLAAAVDRRTPVVALGGGVVGDVAGFVAATVLRGLPFVQIPTTLLAMVDASVGGKTGVNHPAGKNLVGAFHQPRLVWAAVDTLGTLPPRERRAGLGEVLKTGLIGDLDLLGRIDADAEGLAAGDGALTREVVARCVRAKAEVVARDAREAGIRALLNAGHTVGHGLENVLGYGTVLHGEAVALGLVAEARYAVRIGVCEEEDLPERVRRWAGRLGLPDRAPPVDRAAVGRAARLDKKARGGIVRVPLPVRPGVYTFVDVDRDALSVLASELP